MVKKEGIQFAAINMLYKKKYMRLAVLRRRYIKFISIKINDKTRKGGGMGLNSTKMSRIFFF